MRQHRWLRPLRYLPIGDRHAILHSSLPMEAPIIEITKIPKGRITSGAVFFIFLCALLLRLYAINHYDLWFDELGSSMYTSQNLDRLSRLSETSVATLMFNQMKNDPHSPLYYFLVYFYSMTGVEGKALRFLSVIFSMLSLFVFYKLARLLFQHRATSIYALIIMTCNPFHIWYAQEARTYALACFLALLMIYVYLKALKHGNRLYWFAFPVTGLLAIFANYHAAFLLIATGVSLFFTNNRRHAGKWFLSVFIILAGFLLIRPILGGQLSFIRSSFWIPRPSPNALLSTWMVFNLGYTYTTAATPYWAGFALFSILFLYGVYSYYKTSRDNTVILLIALFLPIGISYTFSKLTTPIYLNRQLLIFSPFCYLFIAQGIEAARGKLLKTAGIIGIIVLTAISLANYYRGLMPATAQKRPESHLGVLPKKNYSPLMASLDKEFRDGDMIAVTDIQSYIIVLSHIIRHPRQDSYAPSKMFRFLFYPVSMTPFDNHYLQIEDLIEYLFFEDGRQLHMITFFQKRETKIEKIRWEQTPFRRIWLISSSWDDKNLFQKNTERTRNYMRKRWELVNSKMRDGVYVELYSLEDACRE